MAIAIPKRMQPHTITYWAKSGTDKYGKLTFAAPTSLGGRWEDVNELFIDPKGEEQTSRANIYVYSEVELEGYLYLGASVAMDPTTLDGAWQIRSARSMPDLRNLLPMWAAVV